MFEEIQSEYEEATGRHIVDDSFNQKLNQVEKIESIKKLKDSMDKTKTPYAKMKLDRSIHNLKRFYRKNLDTINKEIKKCVELFRQTGIGITTKDFNFTPYVNQYMTRIFNELERGEVDSSAINAEFEEIYWKCPNIIIHIQLNIRYLFLLKENVIAKNLKKFEMETANRTKVSLEELEKEYNYLKRQYIENNKANRKTIMDKFLSGSWSFKDYDEKAISRCYAKFVNPERLEKNKQEVHNNLMKLLHNLHEYRNYLRFKYLFDDVKRIYLEEKGSETYNSVKMQIIKRGLLLSKAGKLIKESDRDKMLKEIEELCEKLDVVQVKEKIHKHLNDKSNLKDAGNVLLPFYKHLFMCIVYNDKDITEPEIHAQMEEFEEFIRSPYNVICESVLLLEERDIPLMIKDRYNLFDIKITKESLADNNLENLIVDLEKIENYQYIKRLGIKLKDIEALYKMKSIVGDNQ